MQIALVQICVDERLNHEQIRIQVRHKLSELSLRADRILILNEVGGNLGSNFQNSAAMFVKSGDQIIFTAVLHHDDCKAAQIGWRQPLGETLSRMKTDLTQHGVACVVATGHIFTNNNYVVWQETEHIKATA